MLFKVESNTAQILTATAACMGTFVGGTVLGYTSSALPSLQGNTTSNIRFSVSDYEADWIGSLSPVGALCGSLLASPVLSMIGRRRCHLWVTAPVFVASWLLIASAVHIDMLYVGRVLGGAGLGLSLTAAPIMVVETAQVSMRGYLGALTQILNTVGILYCYILGVWLDWSWLAWASLVTVVPYAVLMLLVPDSPVWLLSNRGRQEALESLTWLRGGDVQLAEQELSVMEKESTEEEVNPSYRESFALMPQAPYLKAFLIVVCLMLFQQLSGITAVLFYTVDIFEAAGSDLEPHIATIIVGIMATLGTIGGTLLVERAGRRPLLTTSSSIMTLSLVVLGIYFYMKDHGPTPPGWLPLLCLTTEIIGFSIGYGPLVWSVGAELLPCEIMNIANPIATALNSGGVFLATFTFKSLCKAIQPYGVFWLYGSVALLSVPFSFFCVPETRGLTSEDIRDIFFGKREKNVKSEKSLNII